MKGMIYRIAVKIKEFGEKNKIVFLINFGNKIKRSV